jgi:cytochrome b561
MFVRDTWEGYGIVSRLFHWVMALAIFGMFALGVWMVRLDYYSPYYNAAPDFHRSFGILLLLALFLRWLWRSINIRPEVEAVSTIERRAAHVVHWSFYLLLLALMVSGYLISTPDGRPIDVFSWFSVPSIVQMRGLEDTAGRIHRWLAYAVLALALLHTLAALKHHFVDGDGTMRRMWAGPSSPSPTSERKTHP